MYDTNLFCSTENGILSNNGVFILLATKASTFFI